MERKKKFRLRLNLFDGIILALALAAALLLSWFALRSDAQTPGAASGKVRYTIELQQMIAGSASLIQPGDMLIDTIRNYELGTVTEVEILPSQSLVLDQQRRAYVLATLEGYEDARVTLEASVLDNKTALTVGGGYDIRVGATAYVRGAGFMGKGPIIVIEREGDA